MGAGQELLPVPVPMFEGRMRARLFRLSSRASYACVEPISEEFF